jgi:serine/threonine protein kinase
VFVKDQNLVCIGDVGLVQDLNDEGVCAKIGGTPDYQAPESFGHDPEPRAKQAKGRAKKRAKKRARMVDPLPNSDKSDIWGLGVVFYEVMTLNFIYDGQLTSTQLVMRNFVYSRMQKVQYPEILHRIVDLCLQWVPHKRPSAQALMVMLAGSK